MFRDVNIQRPSRWRIESGSVHFRALERAPRRPCPLHSIAAVASRFPFEIARAASSRRSIGCRRIFAVRPARICLRKYSARTERTSRVHVRSVDASCAKRDTRQYENPRANEREKRRESRARLYACETTRIYRYILESSAFVRGDCELRNSAKVSTARENAWQKCASPNLIFGCLKNSHVPPHSVLSLS